MLRGYYNAGQALINKQRELDVIANNISNVNTAGFRKEEAVLNTFQSEMILVQQRRKTSGHFLQTYVDHNKANLEQSNFEFTESTFDAGIYGNVYFNVRSDRAQYYADNGVRAGVPNNLTANNIYQTRAGQFELDGEGFLTLNKVGRVQGENGDIYIGSDDMIIEEDGVIHRADGTVIDRLLLTYIPPEADVRRIGDSLFSYTGGEALPAGETFNVIQGAFEKSNVDANKEMTQAMEVQRLFEANSAILRQFDQMNAKASGIASLSKA